METVVETALRFVECINHRDVEGILGMLARGHRFVDLEGNEQVFDEISGRAAWSGYFEIAPRYLIHVGETHAVGNPAVLVGRTTGSHLNLPREQEIRQHRLIWSATIRDRKLKDWRLLYDTSPNRAKLGIPAA